MIELRTALDLFPYHSEFRDAIWPSLEQLTPAQLEWKPPGSPNAISFYLRHLAQSEDWFLNTVALGLDKTPKRRAELPDLASMLAYLKETRAATVQQLGSWPARKLEETRRFPPQGFRGKPRDEFTLRWLFTRLFQHEVYHLGQIQLLLRMQGIQPAVA